MIKTSKRPSPLRGRQLTFFGCRCVCISSLAVWVAISLMAPLQVYADAPHGDAGIPEAAIVELISKVDEINPRQSASSLRRAFKVSIRDAQALIGEQPTAAEVDHMVYFRHDDERPCGTEIEMHKTHALILDKLGRSSEAGQMRSKAQGEPTDCPTSYFDFTGYDRPYEVFIEKLSQLKIGQTD